MTFITVLTYATTKPHFDTPQTAKGMQKAGKRHEKRAKDKQKNIKTGKTT